MLKVKGVSVWLGTRSYNVVKKRKGLEFPLLFVLIVMQQFASQMLVVALCLLPFVYWLLLLCCK